MISRMQCAPLRSRPNLVTYLGNARSHGNDNRDEQCRRLDRGDRLVRLGQVAPRGRGPVEQRLEPGSRVREHARASRIGFGDSPEVSVLFRVSGAAPDA